MKQQTFVNTSSAAARRVERAAIAVRPHRFSRYRGGLYLLLLPYIVGTLALVAIPALMTFGLAFTEYDALSSPNWVGLGNFRAIFNDPLFRTAVKNSLFFVALAVPLRVGGALLLALLLHRQRRGVGIYRAAVYIPTIIPDVAYALIWLWIFNPVYGPLNAVLGALHLPTPAWLLHGTSARLAIVIMSVFQIGEGIVVLMAARQQMPREYFDMARVNGGGRWQTFRFITLPLLAPWLLLMTFRDIIVSAQSTFAPAFIMTEGGPYYATLFMPLLIYQEAFDYLRFGRGAAMLLVMFLGIGLLLYLIYKVAGGWGYGGGYE